jgi:hypothetical protein
VLAERQRQSCPGGLHQHRRLSGLVWQQILQQAGHQLGIGQARLPVLIDQCLQRRHCSLINIPICASLCHLRTPPTCAAERTLFGQPHCHMYLR